MDDAAKAPYTEMSKNDQVRHDKQLADFNSLGYFTLEDGTKSTEHQPKVKLGKRAKKQDEDHLEPS